MYVCVSVYISAFTQGGQKRLAELLELELQVVVELSDVGAGN